MAIYSAYGFPVEILGASMKREQGNPREVLYFRYRFPGEKPEFEKPVWELKADQGISEMVSVAKQFDPYINFP